MSNFLIFKAAFNNSVTPAIGTYTANGADPLFNKNINISQNYYLYNTAHGSAVQWFIPTAETTDFEFVADILTREWTNNVTYFIIADSTGTTRLRMWSVYENWHFENSDNTTTAGHPEYIGTVSPRTSGGFGVFHQFRVRVRKLTESSSSVEIYVDNTLKLTATAGAALVTCAKIGFVGGVNTFGPGYDAGVKNVYLYDLGDREVIDRGALSDAFTRFIGWAKNIFATKDNTVLRSGGNLMTGTNLGRPDDSGTFSISGGTTVGGNTGYVKCYGASASSYPGAVEIGGSNIKFIFRNNAIESWAGNQDLGSSSRQFGTAYIKALNINGTAAGDILTHNASEFVPVAGGAVMTATSLGRTNNSDMIQICGGTSENNGSAILLRGKDKSENGGEADIVAKDDTNSTVVNVKPDGTILRVTNNVTKNFAMQEDVNTLLSGKANSSHTHTKSEITDFPSFGTTSGTICEGNDSRLSDARTPTAHNHSASEITSGTLDSARIPNLDASKITSGTIDIDRLPAGALERLVIVADQTARYALTTSSVQLGDTVKQLDTGIMYYVVDTSKLNSADGYSEYTAGSATSVPWSGVTSKPSSFTPSSHTHTTSDITDFPTLATVATSGSYNDLSNKPTIPTYSAGTNLSLSDTTFNVSSTPLFTNITIGGYTITIE